MRTVGAIFALAVASIGSVSGERIVHGATYDLPASAPENKILLDLDSDLIRDTRATFGDALEQNRLVKEQLERMISLPYFSTYKVDLSDRRCPLEDDSATCGNRQCAIEPLSSTDIDEELFKSQYLGRLRKDSVSVTAPPEANVEDCAPEMGSLYASDDMNYCYPEDEGDDTGVWVDLTGNIERFTGYAGRHAHLMWENVYAENCFGYPPTHAEATASAGSTTTAAGAGPALRSATDESAEAHDDLAQVLSHPKNPGQAVPQVGDCMEQRLFYRLLSGMHASVSTHLSYDWLNSTSDKWGPNLGLWLERVGWHEDRLNNMFFDYVLVTRAVSKLVGAYERQLMFSSTCQAVDTEVRIMLRRLGRYIRDSPLVDAIDEAELFSSDEGKALKSEFRSRVRNVNALMSCVGCERCRLWGKLQTAGYGTALKILFELPTVPSDDPEAVSRILSSFRRSELVALINTFARISHSVDATNEFRDLVEGEVYDKASFSYQMRKGLQETKEGFAFILNSYIHFPRNLARYALVRLARSWDRFISGGAPRSNEARRADTEYKIDL